MTSTEPGPPTSARTGSDGNADPAPRTIRKVTVAATWGHGVDGFDLGILVLVLPVLQQQLGLNALELGAVGLAALAGIFVGGLAFGPLTDRIGRRPVFGLVFLMFIAASLSQLFTTTLVPLVIARFANGLAVGAEYTVGAAMLAEFAPARDRGRRVALAQVVWYVGYLAAVATSLVLLNTTELPWNWILATSAIPAVVGLWLRRGIPESPRWLLAQGRDKEAREIIDGHLGHRHRVDECLDRESETAASATGLSRPPQRRRLIFAAAMYLALVVPYFAIFTYAPTVLEALTIENEAVATLSLNAVALFGVAIGALIVDITGRRRLLLVALWICAGALLLPTLAPSTTIIVLLGFFLFSLANSAATILIPLYPSELFPTATRSSATGILTAISRIGAGVGTFLLPLAVESWGASTTLAIGVAVCLAGAITSHWLAPETTRRHLTDTSRSRPAPPSSAHREEPNFDRSGG